MWFINIAHLFYRTVNKIVFFTLSHYKVNQNVFQAVVVLFSVLKNLFPMSCTLFALPVWCALGFRVKHDPHAVKTCWKRVLEVVKGNRMASVWMTELQRNISSKGQELYWEAIVQTRLQPQLFYWFVADVSFRCQNVPLQLLKNTSINKSSTLNWAFKA